MEDHDHEEVDVSDALELVQQSQEREGDASVLRRAHVVRGEALVFVAGLRHVKRPVEQTQLLPLSALCVEPLHPLEASWTAAPIEATAVGHLVICLEVILDVDALAIL